MFLWLDEEGSVTTGAAPTVDAPAPVVALTSAVGTGTNGTNETLNYSVDVSRKFSVSATITTSDGTVSPSWSQDLSYSNTNELTDFGFTQFTQQSTKGDDLAPLSPYARRISYPLTVNSTFVQDATSLSINGEIDRGGDIFVTGVPVFPTGLQSFDSSQYQGSQLSTTQKGTASYLRSPAQNASAGDTSQDLTFSGVQVTFGEGFPTIGESEELYSRSVEAVNGTVTRDTETEAAFDAESAAGTVGTAEDSWAVGNSMQVLGRGRGGGVSEGLGSAPPK